MDRSKILECQLTVRALILRVVVATLRHPSSVQEGGGTSMSGREVSFLTLVVRALALHTAGRGFNSHWILLYLDPLWVIWGP